MKLLSLQPKFLRKLNTLAQGQPSTLKQCRNTAPPSEGCMNKEKPKWSCLSAWAFCFSAAAEKVLSESRAHSNMVKEELRPLRLQRILLFISVIIVLYGFHQTGQERKGWEKKQQICLVFLHLGLKNLVFMIHKLERINRNASKNINQPSKLPSKIFFEYCFEQNTHKFLSLFR